MTNQPPLNPEALEAASRVNDPTAWAMIDDFQDDPGAMRLRDSLIAEASRTVSAYLAAVPADTVTRFDPRELNRRGWTCGCEPGNYDTCDECQSACNELASFLNRPGVG